jgi:hypothetical protein
MTRDIQWQNKVKAGLSGDFLTRFTSGRRVITRRVDELHSRFIIIDDMNVCLLSADLQTDQQTKKYQYAYFTNDQRIAKDAIAYFNDLWTNGEVCDLVAEARTSP